MQEKSRIILVLGSVLGFLGVMLGAFGAHGLRTVLSERGTEGVWRVAVDYQLWHAVLLVGIGIGASIVNGPIRRSWYAYVFALGILFFSGSLYWLALGGPLWLGPITPLGGVFLLLGWLGLCFDGIRGRRQNSQK